MHRVARRGARAGALGFYRAFTPPSSYAARAEIVALCRVLKRYNGAYFTHIRDEFNKVDRSGPRSHRHRPDCGVHVEIVHLKCSGLDNWGKAARILAMIEAARAEGLAIDCDAYPYAAGSNPLKNLLPQWVQSGGMEAMLTRLALAETREGSAPRSIATGSTIGAGFRPGTACRSRSRRICRSMRARRWPRSPRRAAASRSIWSATI